MRVLRQAVVYALIPVAIVTTSLSARENAAHPPRTVSGTRAPATTGDLPLDMERIPPGIPTDTIVLAEYTFDGPYGCDPEGWTSVDLTVAPGLYFHVDDFAGLGGGDSGGLIPLAGNQSLWCGVRPDSTLGPVCNYANAPGYGNNWDQRFESVPFSVSGDVTLSYHIRWDTEAGYDYGYIEYKDTSGTWAQLSSYNYAGYATENWVIPQTAIGDTLRVRFRFRSDGAFSDEDGMWPSDGALIIDSLTVADTAGLIDYQDFESEPVGALTTTDGDWLATIPPGYGDFAALFNGTALLQEDPCVSNLTCMWGFFNGSTYDYSCGGHPEQVAVPYQNTRGQYLDNAIWSPWIDWTHDKDGVPVPATASLTFFQFDVYADLPLDNLIMYVWEVRTRIGANGCPTQWLGDNFFHHSTDSPRWRITWDGKTNFLNLVSPGATEIQLSVKAVDTCPFFCGTLGSGDCHSHSPLIDNVRLIRLDVPGPIFDARDISASTRDMQMFQDNFPEVSTYTRPGTGETTDPGKVRVDIGVDVNFNALGISFGDSLVANITELNVGLDRDVSGGPAAYLHVRELPGKAGADLAGGPQWPYVPSLSGGGWTVIRGDSIPLTFYPQDQYCFDLNDNLFEPGDTIFYYLSARDALGRTTYWTHGTGTTTSEAAVRALPMEMTCLPANGLNGATDILYVDAADGEGVQPFFDYDFGVLGITPDRFDVNPHGFDNGLGASVKDVALQLIPYYKKIIWSSGSLTTLTIGDGSTYSRESDDFAALFDFLTQHTEDCGVYFTGDGLAGEWWSVLNGTSSWTFRNTYMDFNLFDPDHTAVGVPVSPHVTGLTGSVFDGDTLFALGGCPEIRTFDVLSAGDSSSLEMIYEWNPAYGAVSSQQTLNSQGATVGVVLAGFSYDAIRDDNATGFYDRAEHLYKILTWLGNVIPVPTTTGTTPGFVNDLAQNYPNPFNPSTRIKYSLARHSQVSLSIYNVAGQLVKTLVNETRTAGPHAVTWNGRDDRGNRVSSGVYFYRLVAGDFTRTKKLTLLK